MIVIVFCKHTRSVCKQRRAPFFTNMHTSMCIQLCPTIDVSIPIQKKRIHVLRLEHFDIHQPRHRLIPVDDISRSFCNLYRIDPRTRKRGQSEWLFQTSEIRNVLKLNLRIHTFQSHHLNGSRSGNSICKIDIHRYIRFKGFRKVTTSCFSQFA